MSDQLHTAILSDIARWLFNRLPCGHCATLVLTTDIKKFGGDERKHYYYNIFSSGSVSYRDHEKIVDNTVALLADNGLLNAFTREEMYLWCHSDPKMKIKMNKIILSMKDNDLLRSLALPS